MAEYGRDRGNTDFDTMLTSLPDRQYRVLIVDDEPSIVELLSITLKSEKLITDAATNGYEALKRLDEAPPDVMLIDLMMPDMDGQELARQVRARKDFLYLPIVMLTAVNQPPVKLESLESGVDAFLNKPVTREELRITIRSMLRLKASQDRMLEALDRVAKVQDELLDYERKQGQHEAMVATVTACTTELGWPINSAELAIEKLLTLFDHPHEPAEMRRLGTAYLAELSSAMQQANRTLHKLAEVNRFETKEFMDDAVMLDLDRAAAKESAIG